MTCVAKSNSLPRQVTRSIQTSPTRQDFQFSTSYSQAGYTLIEMLVSIALAAIMMSMVFFAFTQASSIFSQSQALTEVYQNSKAILDIMSRDISSMVMDPVNNKVFRSDRLGGPTTLTFILTVNNPLPTGDGIDTDGNNGADEEIYDKKDNDGDGAVDEDVKYSADALAFIATSGMNPILPSIGGNPKQEAAWIEIGYRLNTNTGQLERYTDTIPGGILGSTGEASDGYDNDGDGVVDDTGGFAGPENDNWLPMADNVLSLSFLYWDGTTWWQNWTAPPLPSAVEIRIVLTDEKQRVTRTFTQVVWIQNH